jgi:hypothetical protein
VDTIRATLARYGCAASVDPCQSYPEEQGGAQGVADAACASDTASSFGAHDIHKVPGVIRHTVRLHAWDVFKVLGAIATATVGAEFICIR